MQFVCVIVLTCLSQDCIDNCDRRANAISLVESLPDLNKELLIYLVRFLKVRTIITIVNASSKKWVLCHTQLWGIAQKFHSPVREILDWWVSKILWNTFNTYSCLGGFKLRWCDQRSVHNNCRWSCNTKNCLKLLRQRIPLCINTEFFSIHSLALLCCS